ncbi:zinc finger protein 345-like isoform X2 [Plodia interpunctella]|uniref:zinc finger protein 345-like isoform X2 n=1 Tax=Plodia interpunctella TaxID=58824 RepID=UPI00236808FA|nr:zinc finger protein 345-like isoform X2 [Plodia interpunctella]
MPREVDVKALVSHIVLGNGMDKCRICMGDTTNGQVHLGDTVMTDDDKPVTLAELLEIITGVEVLDEPLCPIGICITCVAHVLAAQEFRIFVKNSQKLWSKALSSLHGLPEGASPPVKTLCAFIKPDTLALHTYKNYTGGDSKTVLNKIKSRLTKKKRVVRTGPPCECPDCGKHFLSPHYLSMHLSNSGQKEVCAVCGLIVFRGRDTVKHMAEAHGQNVSLCKYCPQFFKNELQLKKHVKNAHRLSALTCSDCGRTFPRKASFEAHSQMHAVRTCRACGAQFTNRACYREHRAKCEPDAKPDVKSLPRNKRCNVRDPAYFICDYCGKVYTSRPQLKNHIIWIHMNVRPYQCTYCEKRFYTAGRMAEHTVVHTRERNFECDICGAKLVSKMAAVYHRRRHTGEKPYECKDCGEKFLSASRRSEHAKRRHGKGIRHQCLHCPANFVRTCDLKKHTEKYHNTPQNFMVAVES